jgi:hypothetical protein
MPKMKPNPPPSPSPSQSPSLSPSPGPSPGPGPSLCRSWGESARLFGGFFGQCCSPAASYFESPTLLTRSYMLCMCLPRPQPIAFFDPLFVAIAPSSALASPSCSNGTYASAAHASPHASSGSTERASGRAEQVGTTEGLRRVGRSSSGVVCLRPRPGARWRVGGIDGPALEPVFAIGTHAP